jgi:hypothetical protein
MNASTMVKISLSFSLDKLHSGILIYELQRKGNEASSRQSSANTTSTEVIENTSKMMRLLVTWKIDRSWESRVHIVLVEHNSELVLNEDKLAQLYDRVNDQISRRYNTSKSTWLVYDNAVLEVTYKAIQKEDFGLKVDIFKGAKDEYTKSALWIDPER